MHSLMILLESVVSGIGAIMLMVIGGCTLMIALGAAVSAVWWSIVAYHGGARPLWHHKVAGSFKTNELWRVRYKVAPASPWHSRGFALSIMQERSDARYIENRTHTRKIFRDGDEWRDGGAR